MSGTAEGKAKVVTNKELRCEYVPNQILVKFQPEAFLDGERTAVGTTQSLKRFEQRFPLRKCERLFPEFAKYQRRMEVLRKKAPAQLTRQEKRLLQRSRRGAAGTQGPRPGRGESPGVLSV